MTAKRLSITSWCIAVAMCPLGLLGVYRDVSTNLDTALLITAWCLLAVSAISGIAYAKGADDR